MEVVKGNANPPLGQGGHSLGEPEHLHLYNWYLFIRNHF